MRAPSFRPAVIGASLLLVGSLLPAGQVRAEEPAPAGCRTQWVYSSGGTGAYVGTAGFSDGEPISKLQTAVATGDPTILSRQFINMTGDGRTDVFNTYRRADGMIGWRVSSAASGIWTKLDYSVVAAEDLRFGDFDGDAVTDVFVALPMPDGTRQWMFSSAGVAAFQPLARVKAKLGWLRFGDFDGNGRTDVVAFVPTPNGWTWKRWADGLGPADVLRSSPRPPAELVLADLDGDGKTDVLTSVKDPFGAHRWFVSDAGRAAWVSFTKNARPVFKALFASDFTGDGRTDLFFTSLQPDGRYRWSIVHFVPDTGAYTTTKLAVRKTPPTRLRIGRFDADAKTDIFASLGSC